MWKMAKLKIIFSSFISNANEFAEICVYFGFDHTIFTCCVKLKIAIMTKN